LLQSKVCLLSDLCFFSPSIEQDAVPKDAGVDATAIRSIAIDILACFSSQGDLLVRKEFKDRVPAMLHLLSARYVDAWGLIQHPRTPPNQIRPLAQKQSLTCVLVPNSDDTDNSSKILKMLIRISTYPQIAMVLTNPRYQSTVVSFILSTFDRKGSHLPHAYLFSIQVSKDQRLLQRLGLTSILISFVR